MKTLEEAARELVYTLDSVAANHLYDWSITPDEANRLGAAALEVKKVLYADADVDEVDADHHPDSRVRGIARKILRGESVA